MNDRTRTADDGREREHEGDSAIRDAGKEPGKKGTGPGNGGTASGHTADGSHSRHDERDAGRSA